MMREEAIEILNDEKYLIWETKEEEAYCLKANEAFDMAIEALEGAPPKGHWIVKHIETVPNYLEEWFYCSECGEGQLYGMPHFCPHCGADMRGETYDE